MDSGNKSLEIIALKTTLFARAPKQFRQIDGTFKCNMQNE